MTKINRRRFLYSSAVLAAVPGVLSAYEKEKEKEKEKKEKSTNFLLGVISEANNPEEDLKIVRDLGFPTCQLGIESYSSQLAKRLSDSLVKYNLLPTSLICMGPGEYKWNFTEGPSTIGLVPRANRKARVERLKQGIDFCRAAGIPAVHAHFGFIPEDPADILYKEFIATMKPLGEFAKNQGIDIYFETGQETPVTLLRAITDIGTGNLFVNYDTANLVMYGKSNPVDGLKVIGKYVKALHAKDGMYPVDPSELGKEVPIPIGEVNFPAVFSLLKYRGFNGHITIEYELGEQNREYILRTKNYLEKIIESL
jgi:sugar phosphate isomerase/epimerase